MPIRRHYSECQREVTSDPHLYWALLAIFMYVTFFFYFTTPCEYEYLQAEYPGTKAGPPYGIISTRTLTDPEYFDSRHGKPSTLGDGSGVGTLDGDPSPMKVDTRDDSCQCVWIQSNISVVPFIHTPNDSGKKKHGLCSVKRLGRVFFGDYDLKKKVCTTRIAGKKEDSTVFQYLSGNCETPFKKRDTCAATQGDVLLDVDTGICSIDEVFGYASMRNGEMTCVTPETEQCAGFNFIPIGGAYCLPPSVHFQ